MLDRLTSLLTRHKVPLASAKAAQSWWRPLDETDPENQLLKVDRAVADFLAGKQPLSLDVLQSLLWLDNAVQPALESICFQYVSNPRMPREIEQKLWRLIHGFSQRMVEAYGRYVQAEGGENSTNAFDSEMPKILARSLRYLAIQAKWHYFRFEKTPPKLWKMANQYYRLAEIESFDSNPFTLYPSISEQVTSCADEYIQMLMLATVSNNNLTAMQMDNLDTWLERWSKLLQLDRNYHSEQHHYRVSLLGSNGPQKIDTTMTGELCRYWGVGELVRCIHEKLAQLEGGATPQSLELGEKIPSVGVIELLKQLDQFWTMSMRHSQIQRMERFKVNKSVHVIHGLDSLCAHVREDNNRHRQEFGTEKSISKVDFDEVMDMRLYGFVSDRTRTKLAQSPHALQDNKQQVWQTWIVDNESVSGLGTVLNSNTNEWVKPGRLIGVRFDEKDNWRVGVVRRLNRLNHDELFAGIQILANTPVTVTMRSDELDRMEGITVTDPGFHGGIDLPNVKMALYLPHKVEGANINSLIMRAADYSPNRVCRVQARDKVFSVSLGVVLEKGVDWTWVTVNVLNKEK